MISDFDDLTSQRLTTLNERARSPHTYLRDLALRKLREFPNEPEYTYSTYSTEMIPERLHLLH